MAYLFVGPERQPIVAATGNQHVLPTGGCKLFGLMAGMGLFFVRGYFNNSGLRTVRTPRLSIVP